MLRRRRVAPSADICDQKMNRHSFHSAASPHEVRRGSPAPDMTPPRGAFPPYTAPLHPASRRRGGAPFMGGPVRQSCSAAGHSFATAPGGTGKAPAGSVGHYAHQTHLAFSSRRLRIARCDRLLARLPPLWPPAPRLCPHSMDGLRQPELRLSRPGTSDLETDTKLPGIELIRTIQRREAHQ